ncbi:MAG TPA: NHL repeat-containing protein [Solirubrobacterales bacterium]
MNTSLRPRRAAALLALTTLGVLASLLVLAGSALAASTLAGKVTSAGKPVRGARVALYAAGPGPAAWLAGTRAGKKGEFALSYENPGGEAVLYVVAQGGFVAGGGPESRRLLMSVAGLGTSPLGEVQVNDQTTVASGYALSRFLHGRQLSGPAPGLQNAAATVSNLVEPRTGKVSFVLANSPNGNATEALPTFNTLANAVAACSLRNRACDRLFELTRPPGGPKPNNTLDAMVDLAKYPTRRTRLILEMQGRRPLYEPALESSPAAWTIALAYTGGGFDAPGRLAFDSKGRIWVTNNWEPPTTLGGQQVTVLSPTGQPILHSPLYGGGVFGAGFGIAIDQSDRVWVGNYAGNSVSLFDSSGDPLSPARTATANGGFTEGEIAKAQGLAVDQHGNVWIPNFGGESVTVYWGGNPATHTVVRGGGISKPFDIAVDRSGNAWVTDESTSGTPGGVTKILPNGTVAPGSPITGGGLRSPQGIAVDSGGNLWVANLLSSSVTEIAGNGKVYKRSPIKVKSLTGPWGIAVDGEDNVWVAGFRGPSLTELCGRKPGNCPRGKRTGDAISPAETGFQSRALQHLTAVQVDQSGNVWVANNWSTGSSLAQFVGGNGLVEFIGAAAPVKTPLIGPPERP